MQLVRSGKPVEIRLRKNLMRAIKRGHAWLYSDAIDTPRAPSGSVALLCDAKEGKRFASGIYDPEHAIPLRICRTQPPFSLDDEWLKTQLRSAAQLRQTMLGQDITGYRLVAGEGDGLPGLIIDVYERVAVIKLDGGAPESFYQPAGIAAWLRAELSIEAVVLRSRERGRVGELLCGHLPHQQVEFGEHGMRLTADVIQGQKTGFFLDQRDNRALIRTLSHRRRVLNLFSFNGGFSVAAGQGGALHVTSVDIAAPAIEAANAHWRLNGLPAEQHTGVAEDCFAYLERAIAEQQQWELVICDPPSFAPNEKVRERALAAYNRLAQLAATVTASGGLLALASCSSHVSLLDFTVANSEGIGRARRSATLLAERGLPLDHPTPLAMPELRYLKFQLFRLS